MEFPKQKDSNQLDLLKRPLVSDFNKEIDIKENEQAKNKHSQNKEQTIQSLLILDTETTGLDEKEDEVIEIGCILFHVESRSVLSQVSFLLPVCSNKAEGINGISAASTNFNQPWEDAIKFFLKLVDASDLIVAHNVEFDKKWFGIGRLPEVNKKWVCSLEDINWSFKKNLKSRPSVTDLALAFQIPVWNLHRALSDCYYISEVFKKCENLEDLLIKATEPRFLFKAIVSYDQRALAKEAGFRWNSPVLGAWTKKMSEDEAKKLEFEVQLINMNL